MSADLDSTSTLELKVFQEGKLNSRFAFEVLFNDCHKRFKSYYTASVRTPATRWSLTVNIITATLSSVTKPRDELLMESIDTEYSGAN